MRLGFIDYYLDEWHANNYPERIRELSNGKIEVAFAFAEIDSPNGGLTTDEWCKKFSVERCKSIEELTERSDGIIILSPDNCERHEALCRVPLASGKPCYVDKTFAPSKAAAKRIFENAQAHSTPCYSSSALRYAAEFEGIDTTSIQAISSWGDGVGSGAGYEVYSIHQLEPVMMLMNSSPVSVMLETSGEAWYTLLIKFEDGRCASVSGFVGGSPFMMNIVTTDGNRVVNVESDYFGAFLKALVNFFETGTTQVKHQTTIDIMAVREAGLRALEHKGEWVTV